MRVSLRKGVTILNDCVREGHSDSPVVIDGVNELETLLPVNKLTGRRADVSTLLSMQFSKDSRLLQQIFTELPVVQSDPNISDSDKFDVLVDRLSTGTPYENEVMMHKLADVADVLFPREVQQNVDNVVDAASDVGVDVASPSA